MLKVKRPGDFQAINDPAIFPPRRATIELTSPRPATAIPEQDGVTPDKYLIGMPALRMAIMAPQRLAGLDITASAATVAFALANLAQLKPKTGAADGMAGRQ